MKQEARPFIHEKREMDTVGNVLGISVTEYGSTEETRKRSIPPVCQRCYEKDPARLSPIFTIPDNKPRAKDLLILLCWDCYEEMGKWALLGENNDTITPL